MPHSKPYIQMFSIHGLLRSENLELGRDADTGGQINYVLELARNLSEREDIDRVEPIAFDATGHASILV